MIWYTMYTVETLILFTLLFMLYFLPPPPRREMTRRERMAERLLIEKDLQIAKQYAIGIIAIFIASIFVWIATATPTGTTMTHKEILETVHAKICTRTPDSILCLDRGILEKMQTITTAKKVPFELVIWIAFAESSLHTNYNRPICKEYNNLWGLKGYKRDNWKLEWYDNRNGSDKNWCWLYRFESIEQGTEAISNTLALWYTKCEMSVKCIAYNYVWKPDIAEQSWIDRVWIFYK